MGKNVVCVFAHPDDEAFGPSGAIYKLSQSYDVYLICATKGDLGVDSRKKHDDTLAHCRKIETLASAKVLGIKKVYFLGFRDGTLSNKIYHKLAEKIKKYIDELKPEIVLTFEPHGLSGHIDHITVTMATQFVLRNNKDIRELWMYCVEKGQEQVMRDYFIYFPEGYKKQDIKKTFNIRDVWDIKIKSMKCHESQLHDFKTFLKKTQKSPKEEHFLVKRFP